jgi:hypothetical protein
MRKMPEHKLPKKPKIEFPQVPPTGNYMYIITPKDTTYAEGKVLIVQPTVDMLMFGVGGYFEVVPRFTKFGGRSCVAFCNTDGKQMGLLQNHLAQILWEENVGRIINEDYLVGNIVIIVAEPSFMRAM